MGRLTGATTNYSFTTFGNQTVQYVYDAASNRTRLLDPQHLETFYTYDALNRLTDLSGVAARISVSAAPVLSEVEGTT
jgi:YD repeat-containing protein